MMYCAKPFHGNTAATIIRESALASHKDFSYFHRHGLYIRTLLLHVMRYDDAGCSSMFQLTHCVSSINSDAMPSSKCGTVPSLTSLQLGDSWKVNYLKLEGTTIFRLKHQHIWGLCNGSHISTGSFQLELLFNAILVSKVSFLWHKQNSLFITSNGRATRHGETSQEEVSCSALPATAQKTGDKQTTPYQIIRNRRHNIVNLATRH